jgi:hypothetical protein
MAAPTPKPRSNSKRPRRLPSTPCSASSDRRTRAGRRKEILDHIRLHGGFSIFWVTEHHLRAVVAEEMQEAGEIVTDNKTYGFPWIRVQISKQNASDQIREE